MMIAKRLDSYFRMAERGSDLRRECIGGVTTFLAMAYIIVVNPAILADAGMDRAALITATCLAAFFGTTLLGLWARVPFAMAPGMGLNAFFTYTLVLGRGLSWQTALGVVFVSGLLFLVLTAVGAREKIVSAIPLGLRLAAAAGIGLFISLIGLKNLGLIVADSVTLVGLGEFTTPVVLGLAGLLVIAILEVRKIRGAILIGIGVSTLLGVLFGEVTLPKAIVAAPPSLAPLFMQLDIGSALQLGLAGAIFSFMFVDLFDSVGTLVACSYQADHVDEDGTIRDLDRMLEADALATVLGSLFGTSTTTTYIESATGIGDGARTGLASLVTGVLFLAALFFAPLAGAVPPFATAPALVVVGGYMFRTITALDFANLRTGLPAFLTIITMPLTFSIATGLSIGFLSYTAISALGGRGRDVEPAMWIIGALSLINLLISS